MVAGQQGLASADMAASHYYLPGRRGGALRLGHIVGKPNADRSWAVVDISGGIALRVIHELDPEPLAALAASQSLSDVEREAVSMPLLQQHPNPHMRGSASAPTLKPPAIAFTEAAVPIHLRRPPLPRARSRWAGLAAVPWRTPSPRARRPRAQHLWRRRGRRPA